MNEIKPQLSTWKTSLLWSIGIVFVTLLIEFWMFGKIMFSPNQYMICGNADGRQIYFNVLWHVKYGSGYILSNQNHPYYESIFMTDAQGFLSMFLNFINHNIIKVEKYTMGIFNSLLLYSIPFCSLSLFAVFNSLRVNKYIGFGFAILITFMSPQISRLISGHYGLAYLFQFPLMAFLFITLKRYNFSLKMALLFLVIFFMGLNNGHLAMEGILFLLSFGVASKFYKNDAQSFSKHAVIGIAIIITFLFYGIVKLTDFVTDREAYPWGFLHYYAQFESIFLPAQGKIFDIYDAIIPVKIQEPRSEGIAYVGVLGLMVQIFMVVRVFYFFIKKKKNRILRPTLNQNLNILLLSSYFILTYAMIIPIRFKLEFIVDYFPFLHQFRAPGRFAWIFYDVFLIYVAYMVHLLFRLYNMKQKKYISFFLSLGLHFCIICF